MNLCTVAFDNAKEVLCTELLGVVEVICTVYIHSSALVWVY